MTRTLALVLALFAVTAQAQQYVRPSKGISFSPFSDTGLDGGWYVPAPSSGIVFGTPGQTYDWSAFEAARVRIYPVIDGNGPDGGPHSLDVNTDGLGCSGMTTQYTVSELGSFIRFRRIKYGLLLGYKLQLQDAPTINGPWAATGGTNNQVSLNSSTSANFNGCWVRIQVTPIPFAPTSSGTTELTLPDGGIAVSVTASTSTIPYACSSSSVHYSALSDGGIMKIGTTIAPLPATRVYTVVTNNGTDGIGGGTSVIKCNTDATPSLTVGAPGTVLTPGQSVVYTTPTGTPIECIGASVWIGGYVCGQ